MEEHQQQQQQHRRKETAELGARQQHHHLAKASSSTAAATATRSQDALVQPIIIECRKKNSKQESVITHRFRKGRLLGKVWLCAATVESNTCESFWSREKGRDSR